MQSWRRDGIIMLVMIGVALLFRLPLLGGSFWLDEAAQALEVTRPWHQQLQLRGDFQPPLLHVWLHIWQYFSVDEAWLRWWGALLPGLGSILFAMMITREFLDEGLKVKDERDQLKTAKKTSTFTLKKTKSAPYSILTFHSVLKNLPVIISPLAMATLGLLLATNSFHIFYSQELRPYALSTVWAMLSWLALIKLDSKWWSGVWIVSSILGVFSSYLYPFLLFGQLAWLAAHNQRKLLLINVAAVGLCFSLWLPSFLDQLDQGGYVRQQLPNWEEVVSFDQFRSLAITAGKFIWGVEDLQVSTAIVTGTGRVVGLGLIVVVQLAIGKGKLAKKEFQDTELDTGQPILCLCMARAKSILRNLSCILKFLNQPWLQLAVFGLLLPLSLAWLISLWIPVVQPKRVLWIWPLGYTILVLLLSYLWIQLFKLIDICNQKTINYQLSTINFLPSGFLILLLLTINLSGTFSYWTNPNLQREDWRQVVSDVNQKFDPNTTALISVFDLPFSPLRWYQPNVELLATNQLAYQSTQFAAVEQQLVDVETVLVIEYLQDLSDPERRFNRDLEQAGWVELEQGVSYPLIGELKVFSNNQTYFTTNVVKKSSSD